MAVVTSTRSAGRDADRGNAFQYTGLSVLRDLGRYRGAPVLAPVVFTSALGLGELFCRDVTEAFGTPSWIISQGPQVFARRSGHRIRRRRHGELGRPRGRFPRRVSSTRCSLITSTNWRRLTSTVDEWEASDPPALPADQRAVRDTVNSRTADPSGETLHQGFFRRAEQQPDAPAVFASSGDLSYTQFARPGIDTGLQPCARTGFARVTRLAVMGPKTAEQVPALLGILAAGGVYLPISLDQPPGRAERILRDRSGEAGPDVWRRATLVARCLR